MAYQLWSHAHLYENKETGGAAKSVKYPDSVRLPHWSGGSKKSIKGSTEALNGVTATSNVLAGATAPTTGPVDGEAAGRPSMSESHLTGIHHPPVSSDGHLLASIPEPEAEAEEEDDGEEVEEPQTSVLAATLLLIGVTVLVAFTAEFLVDSINGLVEDSPLSQEWVSLLSMAISRRALMVQPALLGRFDLVAHRW